MTKYKLITHDYCARCGKRRDLYLRAYTCKVQGLYCALCCTQLDSEESDHA